MEVQRSLASCTVNGSPWSLAADGGRLDGLTSGHSQIIASYLLAELHTSHQVETDLWNLDFEDYLNKL